MPAAARAASISPTVPVIPTILAALTAMFVFPSRSVKAVAATDSAAVKLTVISSVPAVVMADT